MAHTVIGLDGIERDFDSVFEVTCGSYSSHGLNTIAGYIVRQTFPGDAERAQLDRVKVDGATSFGAALGERDKVRAEGVGWALVDHVYECGCRGQA